MPSLTRGSLPPGVYWRRRVLVLGTVGAVVLLVVALLGGGPGREEDADVSASTAGAPTSEPSAGPTTTPPTASPTTGSDAAEDGPGEEATEAPLATPVGRCESSDVLVTPAALDAVAGRAVPIALTLQTATTEACTWRMSSRHLAVTITRDDEEIWTSRECPGLVPEQDVVVRRLVPATVTLTWNARRSERGCPTESAWVEPGSLDVAAAAYGGQPSTTEVDLAAPEPQVVPEPVDPAEPDRGDGSDEGRDQNGNQGQGNQGEGQNGSQGQGSQGGQGRGQNGSQGQNNPSQGGQGQGGQGRGQNGNQAQDDPGRGGDRADREARSGA